MYVEMKDICKNYGDFRASDHVSFGIEKGKLAALLGPSGSGKSMVLKCIAGIITPDAGRIVLDDEVLFDSNLKINISPQKRKMDRSLVTEIHPCYILARPATAEYPALRCRLTISQVYLGRTAP